MPPRSTPASASAIAPCSATSDTVRELERRMRSRGADLSSVTLQVLVGIPENTMST